jgi:hypothetical protein
MKISEICANLQACQSMLLSIVEGVKHNKQLMDDPLSLVKNEKARRDRYKKAFYLRQEGKTYKEIGKILGVGPGRAKSLVAIGKDRLAEAGQFNLFLAGR